MANLDSDTSGSKQKRQARKANNHTRIGICIMNRDQQKAFNLVELLVTLSVAGILLSLAIPELRNLIETNRDAALRNLLLSHLSHTRMQAVTNNRSHILCGSSNGNVCDGDWNSNWLMLAASDDSPLQQYQLNSSKKLCWSRSGNPITYRPNGTSPTSNGRFALCDGETASWQLVINRQGRVRQASANEGSACCAGQLR